MLRRLAERLRSHPLAQRAQQDETFRAVLLSCGGLCLNLGFALLQGYYLLTMPSFWWYVTMFAYYLLIALMRILIIRFAFGKGRVRSEATVLCLCGVGVCMLGLVLSGVTVLMIRMALSSGKPMILMIMIAAYTFWKAVNAILNIVRARRRGDLLLIAMRNIACADAAMSMLILAHAMLSTFDDPASAFTRTMDMSVGAGAFLVILILGVGMILEGIHKRPDTV